MADEKGRKGYDIKSQSARRTSVSVTAEYQAPETPAERAARLEIEKADAAHRRRKEVIILVSTLAVMAACLWVILSGRHTPDNEARAFTLLSVIVSAAGGYVFGTKAVPKSAPAG
jgi:hypothetical protein